MAPTLAHAARVGCRALDAMHGYDTTLHNHGGDIGTQKPSGALGTAGPCVVL